MLVGVLALSACSDGGGHMSGADPGSVTDIPPGDGVGTSASGEWEAETLVVDCQGACPLVAGDATCDVGHREGDDIVLTQEGGVLRIDLDETGVPSRLTGGIDADGSFEVAGYGTELSGDVEIVALSEGQIVGDLLEGTLELWGTGAAGGETIDCFVEMEVVAERE